jgi:ADP-heptose:LPS heptosyltransferase
VSERPTRVLAVRTGALGDVVNALTFATAIADAWPGVEIGWAAHAPVLPLLEGHPALARVHRWPRERGLAGFLEVAREVRRERYELAVDLQRIVKSALLARASGAPRVLGFDRARTKEASWLLLGERIPPGPAVSHRVEQYLEVARHLGARAAAARHAFPSDPAADEHAERLLRGLGERPVAIALGASKPGNRWAPERFGAVAARIAGELERPVFLLGAGAERPLAERALAAAAGEPAHGGAPVSDLVGRTDLRQLSALLARAALFVGCDTGPMHLAAARGTRVVALFGPADPRVTGPYGEGHRVVSAPAGSTAGRGRMQDIEVEAVVSAVREALAEPLAAARSGTGSARP